MLESLDGRRALTGAKNQIKEIRARHQIIMRLHLAGASQVDIAKVLDITPQMVSIVQNSDIYKAEFNKLQAAANQKAVEENVDIQKRIENLAGKSLTVLEELLNDAFTDGKLKADVAFDILDRGGYRPAQKVTHTLDWGARVQDAYQTRKLRAASATVDVTPQLAAPEPTPTLESSDSDNSPDSEEIIADSEDSSASAVATVG